MGLFSSRKRKQAENAENGGSMSFFDHLEALRWHLMRMVLAIVVIAIVLFIYRQEIIGMVFMSPFKGDFPTHQLLCQYFSDEFCFVEVPVMIQAVSPYEQFMKALTYAFFGGIIIAFPYLIWEIWRFIKPGLRPREVRAVRWNTVVISLLFFTGVTFGYFVILPFSIKFFSVFTLFDGIRNDWRIGEVISFVMMLLFGCGFLFQLPVITYYLTKMGMLSVRWLKKYRKHAVVVVLIIAALITPPDPFSQILIGLPLMLLYEVGILIARRVERRQRIREQQELKTSTT